MPAGHRGLWERGNARVSCWSVFLIVCGSANGRSCAVVDCNSRAEVAGEASYLLRLSGWEGGRGIEGHATVSSYVAARSIPQVCSSSRHSRTWIASSVDLQPRAGSPYDLRSRGSDRIRVSGCAENNNNSVVPHDLGRVFLGSVRCTGNADDVDVSVRTSTHMQLQACSKSTSSPPFTTTEKLDLKALTTC